MSGFGIQKRGTGKAVKRMSLGGALAIKSKAYQGKPGTYEQSYYTQALFPQVTQAGYVPPPEESKKEEEKEKKEGMVKGGDVMPSKNKKNFRPTKSGAGMTQAGVMAYRRMNPGSKLSTAVTGKVKPGSKAAKRRKSYCARSAGQMKMFPNAAKDPNSRLRQARRRWKC
jgi:hypothetical protein